MSECCRGIPGGRDGVSGSAGGLVNMVCGGP